MRSKQLLAMVGIVVLCVVASARVQGQTPAPPPLSPADKLIAEDFEKRAKEYSKMREALEGQMPKFSKRRSLEEIQTHKKQFQERVRQRARREAGRRVHTLEAAT